MLTPSNRAAYSPDVSASQDIVMGVYFITSIEGDDRPVRELKHFKAGAIFHATGREHLPAQHEGLSFERIRGGFDLQKLGRRRGGVLRLALIGGGRAGGQDRGHPQNTEAL